MITRKTFQFRKYLFLLLCIFGLGLFMTGTVTPAQGQSGYITDVREIETAELGVGSPVGIAYSPLSGFIQLMDRSANRANNPALVSITMYEDPAGAATILDTFSDPLNIAFNGRKNSLYHLNQDSSTLDEIPADANGNLLASANVSTRADIKAYGLQNSEGMTFNSSDGTLYLLDPAGKRMVRVIPDANGNYDSTPANNEGRIQRIDLKHLGASHLRGIAFNPSNSHLYVLGPKEKNLFEITETGELVNTFDVSPFLLRDPGAMVFAPSGDNTDDPAIQDLFIADSGQAQAQASGPGQILELSLTAPVLQALPAISSNITLVQTILTSRWSPPSPDPTGLEYRTATGKLFVTDSEVDEMAIWRGKNTFESTTSGSLTGTCSTTAFSKEIAGTAENPSNKHLFISDDGKNKVFEIDLGPDNTYCTTDDRVRAIDVFARYNDTDPEGLAYGGGKLFATDGLGTEVYAIGPGGNGIIGDGDDQVTHFDTNSMGIRDPEGIGYNTQRGSLFIVSRKDQTLVETSPTGTVLNRFDISPFNVKSPAGVGCGPGSKNSSVFSIYVSARGVDNNQDPNENDGKIYEFTIGG